jgi:hypothetical protein
MVEASLLSRHCFKVILFIYLPSNIFKQTFSTMSWHFDKYEPFLSLSGEQDFGVYMNVLKHVN